MDTCRDTYSIPDMELQLHARQNMMLKLWECSCGYLQNPLNEHMCISCHAKNSVGCYYCQYLFQMDQNLDTLCPRCGTNSILSRTSKRELQWIYVHKFMADASTSEVAQYYAHNSIPLRYYTCACGLDIEYGRVCRLCESIFPVGCIACLYIFDEEEIIKFVNDPDEDDHERLSTAICPHCQMASMLVHHTSNKELQWIRKHYALYESQRKFLSYNVK